MPSAAEIYSQIRPVAPAQDPLEQYGRMVSIKSLMGGEQLNEMQRTKLSRDMQEEEAFRNLFAGATPEQISAPDFLQRALAASPTRGLTLQKSMLDREKSQADLAKTKVETHAAQVKQLRDMTARVQTDADLGALREEAMKVYGQKALAGIPQSVSAPGFADWQRRETMDADKFIAHTTPKMEKFDLGGRVITVDVNPVTNPAIKTMGFTKTMTPGEVASNRVALANLQVKGAEATPGGVFSIPDIVARAGAGGAAPAPGSVTPAQLVNGSGNALPQAPAAPAQPAQAPAAAPAAAVPGNAISDAIAKGLTGDELLKAIPRNVADQVKMMVEGRMAPPTSFALAKPYWNGMMALATAYDPAFDETVWKARNATRTNFASGTEGRNLTAINTAIGHLDSFDKAAQALNNNDYPLFNKMLNAVGPQVGATNLAGRIRTFEQAKEAVSNELMRVFRGVGASSSDTAKWAETLNASDSPEALRQAVKGATDLLESRIGALGEQYRKGMSTKSDVDVLNMVYPKARATLERLKSGKGEAPELGSQVAAGRIGGNASKPGGIKFLGFE